MNKNIKAHENILLLEIGVEEIPHSSIDPICSLLKNIFKFLLRDKNILFSSLYLYYTPRRIVLFAPNIVIYKNNFIKKIYGPSVDQFININGDLNKIGIFFLKKFLLSLDDIEIEEKKGCKKLIANKKIENIISVKKIIHLIRKIILGINYYKKMKWNNSNIEFIRPIKWITSFFNNKFLLFKVANILTQKYTYGHRFFYENKIKFINSYEYFNEIERKMVILSSDKRKEWITNKIIEIFYSYETPLINKKILILQSKLLEYPAILIAKFNSFFLLIPNILLIDEINNLHTIIVIKNNNKLINKFIIIINIKANKGNYRDIIKGYKNVLESKFADILFYIKNDLNLKYLKRIDILKEILLHKKLGTIYNKIIRIKFLSNNIILFKNIIKNNNFFLRIIDLCKLDLTTNMVQKIPALKGKIGYIYGKYLKEFKVILDGIIEHYCPRKINNNISKNICFSLISLIDKFDFLVSVACVEGLPTGNNDLFGLRRNRSIIIKIILESPISISISDLIFSSLNILLKQNIITKKKFINIAPAILCFFYRKMEYIYLKLITSKSIVNNYVESENLLILLRSIIESHTDNFFILWKKIKSILLVLNNNIYINDFMKVIKRIKNILIKVKDKNIIINYNDLLFSNKELIINKKIIKMKINLKEYINNKEINNDKIIENYYIIQTKILLEISILIKKLFEEVLIMDNDVKKRNSRLFLLIQFYKMSRKFFILNK